MSVPAQIGPYRVERLLGTGGFASVWLAHDPGLDGHVAIKILADNWSHDPAIRDRFVQEGRLLWQLDDERVLRVHAIGELPDGRPYLVTAWADRGSLAERLAGPPLPTGQAVALLRAIADGVAVLHRQLVVHRDLTPGNVLFRSRPDGAEQVIIADLGLAKALALSSGVTMGTGTPAFTAPEQRAGLSVVDERADVYALGMLGQALLRQGPPPAVAALLDRATALGPDRRPRNAGEFLAELDQALQSTATPPAVAGGLPEAGDLTAPGPAATEPATPGIDAGRSRRSARRRVAVLAAAAVAVAGAGTGGWFWWHRPSATASAGPLVVRLPAGWSATGATWAGRTGTDGTAEPALVVSADPQRWATDPSVPGAFVGLSSSLVATGVTAQAYLATRRHGGCPAPAGSTRSAGGVEWTTVTFDPACGSGRAFVEAATVHGSSLVYVQLAVPAGSESMVGALLAGVTVAG